uniref:UDP-glucosyltransferase UGT87Q1 n=1 Tax=Polygala tenuifolia TaxID=355332 RepID=A0A3G3NC77_9FABA|nr:UDP-glucosyltransferase UGT87Q1 [Polygala tenuifolia]
MGSYSIPVCHVVAMPYPGRGHVNPMMNLCIMLATRKPDILVSFVVTEEWEGLIKSEARPDNVQLATIPNVIPSEFERAKDFPAFMNAVSTKMEAPFAELLDRLDLPPTAIIADTKLVWSIGCANKKNIPIASLWPMSATVYSVLYHLDMMKERGHFPVELSEIGDEVVDYIPGMAPTQIRDLPTVLYGQDVRLLERALNTVNLVSNAQYLMFTTAYEIEPEVIDALQAKYDIPVYAVGPSVPFFKLSEEYVTNRSVANGHAEDIPEYFQWLDSQEPGSVLYISQGSFLSVSPTQMDEIVAGIRESGIKYLWVARGDVSQLKSNAGDNGMVVPWVDQLRVLCHPAVGGFWSHCGWNSSLESAFSGLPVLTYPIFWDQVPNSKKIVEEWKTGWRVRRKIGHEDFVSREVIADIAKRFMDPDNEEVKKTRERAKEVRASCLKAISKGGSTEKNLYAFIEDITAKAQKKSLEKPLSN